MEILIAFIGVAWFCNENGSLDISGSVNSVLAQFLPRSAVAEKCMSCDTILSIHEREEVQYQKNIAISDRSALIAGITNLLRRLLHSLQWSKQLSESISESLSCLSSSTHRMVSNASAQADKIFINWDKERMLYVNGICAIYVLGGLIEQPHIGSEVYFPTPHNTAIDFIGSTISGTSQPVGTVIAIDWKNRLATVVSSHSFIRSPVSLPLNLLKIAHRPPVITVNSDILNHMINIVKNFLGVPKSGTTNDCEAENLNQLNVQLPWFCGLTNKLPPNADEDIVTEINSVMTLIRARCLRALSALCTSPTVTRAVIDSGMLPCLLRTAVMNVSSAADLFSNQGTKTQTAEPKQKSLGFSIPINDIEYNPMSNVYTSAATLSRKLSLWVSVPSLEQLGEETWSRLHSAPSPLPSKDLKGRPKIIILGGEIAIEAQNCIVKSTSNFPSVRLGNLSLFPLHSIGNLGTPNNLLGSYPPGVLVGGRWYYEAVLLSDGLMQIGWADALYKGILNGGKALATTFTLGPLMDIDVKKWNSSSSDYGKRWRVADVIGCSIDLDSLQMRFSLNGKDLGVAYTGFHAVGGCYPAASFNMQQSARFNFGPPHSQFAFPPPTGYRGISEAIAEAVNAREEADKPGGETCGEMETKEKRVSSSSITRVDHQPGDIALRRQALVDNLISMGFPIDWCIRAANVQRSTVMDESRAIAWIIEKMEFDNMANVAEEKSQGSCATRLAALMEQSTNSGYLNGDQDCDDETPYQFMQINASDQELLERIGEGQHSSDDEVVADEEEDQRMKKKGGRGSWKRKFRSQLSW